MGAYEILVDRGFVVMYLKFISDYFHFKIHFIIDKTVKYLCKIVISYGMRFNDEKRLADIPIFCRDMNRTELYSYLEN